MARDTVGNQEGGAAKLKASTSVLAGQWSMQNYAQLLQMVITTYAVN